jgi:hypothetical protein
VAEYLPKLSETEKPVRAASADLRRALRGADDAEQQADALARYGRSLIAMAKRLDAIDPPALLAPAHRGYVTQLRSYGRSAQALQRGVRAGDQAAVDAAVRQLSEASTPRSQVAQRDAIKAYNARVRRIRVLATSLERERQRLERDLA